VNLFRTKRTIEMPRRAEVTIASHGAISAETASRRWRGARCGAPPRDVAVSVTAQFAGPRGGDARTKPVRLSSISGVAGPARDGALPRPSAGSFSWRSPARSVTRRLVKALQMLGATTEARPAVLSRRDEWIYHGGTPLKGALRCCCATPGNRRLGRRDSAPAPLARRICNEPVVLFATARARAAA
jgi:hypothetical protein